LNVNADDLRIMREMIDYGIPSEFIMKSIERQFTDYKPKHPKDAIHTFSYCEAGVYQDWTNYQEKMRVGETNEQPRGRTKTVTPFRNPRAGEALFSDDELDELNRESARMFGMQ
jgi:hypothetical protein